MSFYGWLVFFHIFTTVVWVGGATMALIQTTRAKRAGDASHLAAIVADLEWIGLRIFTPATLMLLGSGIWMMARSAAWGYSQLWVWLSLVIFGASFLAGILFYGPESGRIVRLAEAHGPDADEVGYRIRRVLWIFRFEWVAVVAVIWLMVAKPGL